MAINDLGMVRPGSTILIPFATYDSNDPSDSVIVSAFVLADIGIYKGTSMTERASTTGVVLLDTDGINIDGAVGIHGLSIDLSSNATADFYTCGSRFYVTAGPMTIDLATTISAVVATFEIGYPGAIVNTTIATLASQTGFTLTAGSAEADTYNGWKAIVHDIASDVQICVGYVSDYAVTTKTVTLAADPGIFIMAAGDHISLFPPDNVQAVAGTTQTAGDLAALIVTADAAIDVAVADLANGTDGLGAIKAETALILTDTGTTLQAELDAIQAAVITNAAGADVAADIIAIKAETAAIVADTDVIDDGTSGLVKIASDVAAILVDTGTTLQGELDGIQADTEDLQTQVGTAGAGLTAIPWNAAWDAEVESEVNDALDTAISELGVAAPTATPTIRTGLMLLYMCMRNKLVVQTSGTDALEIYNNAGTKIATKLLTDDGSDYTEAEMA